MKRNLFFQTLMILLFFSCQKEKITFEPEGPDTHSTIDCIVEECDIEEDFYWKGFINGECWTNSEGSFSHTSHRISIRLPRGEWDGISEFLKLRIYHNTDLRDTIWIGWNNNSAVPLKNIATLFYNYFEDHSSAGSFYFHWEDELTPKDYLLIDDFNEDTTIIEGRFQVNFPQRSTSGFMENHAPDTMRIDCGYFRVQERD